MLRVQDYFVVVVVVLEDATGGKVVEAVYRCYGNGGGVAWLCSLLPLRTRSNPTVKRKPQCPYRHLQPVVQWLPSYEAKFPLPRTWRRQGECHAANCPRTLNNGPLRTALQRGGWEAGLAIMS